MQEERPGTNGGVYSHRTEPGDIRLLQSGGVCGEHLCRGAPGAAGACRRAGGCEGNRGQVRAPSCLGHWLLVLVGRSMYSQTRC